MQQAADEELERFLRGVTEYHRRETVATFKGPGGLLRFTKYFWNVIEPGREMIPGWAMDAIGLHLEAVTAGSISRLLINVPPGFSKPVHVDEPVMTDRGFKRLGDIAIGDRVLTHKGRFKPVTAVHQQGELDLLRVKTWSGRSILTAPDHPFLTTRGWVEATNLTSQDFLAVPRLLEDFGTGEMTAEEARLLGYLVGDGCISQRSLSFVNMERELLDDFVACATACGFFAYEAAHPNGNVKARKVILKSSEKQWNSRLGEQPVLEWLSKHDLYLSNSYTKRIPQAVFRSGPKAIANFLGAYWSCDGMVFVRHKGAKTTMMATATTVSEGLAHDLQRALLTLNIQGRVRTKKVRLESKAQPGGLYTSFEIVTSERNEVAKFVIFERLLGRKMAEVRKAFADRFEPNLYPDEVLSVEAAGSGECRCLTVDDDSSFTVDGLVVHNSLIVNVFWPLWEWSVMGKPNLRYVSFSYAAHLTERDNRRLLDIMLSVKFKELFPKLKLRKKGEELISNMNTGWKLATSVGGVGTGERGDRVCLDDPHNIKQQESDIVRVDTVRWFREAMSNRLNDIDTGAIIVIMQRVHEEDVSGIIIGQQLGYDHLCIEMEYDASRQHIPTSIGWVDPRSEDGELAWPKRFPRKAVDELKITLSEYAYSGQYQQAPEVRGGSIFKRDSWRHWKGEQFPPFIYVVASLDPAYTTKAENDPSGFSIWGVFKDPEDNFQKAMLVMAWRKRLGLHGDVVERYPDETERAYFARTNHSWGLVEWVAYYCRRYKANTLLVETKASGISVVQEIERLYGSEMWAVEEVVPHGDKVSRANAVQPMWKNGLIWCPIRQWSQMVIDEMATFPKGRDDLTDSATQAIAHLRELDLIARPIDVRSAELANTMYREELEPLYQV